MFKKLALMVAIVIAVFAVGFNVQAAETTSITDKLVGFFDAYPAWIAAITTVVTAANAITALTPTSSDDKIINAVLKVLNVLAFNVIKNKNADDNS